jgi:hypothetical protein
MDCGRRAAAAEHMKKRMRALSAGCGVILTFAHAAFAQTFSNRIAVGFVGDRHPSVEIGAEVRDELGSATTYRDSLGVLHRVPPKLLWSAMALSGTTAQLQAGVLYRATNVQRLGAYAVMFARPWSAGAVARYEPASAAGVQLGWLHRNISPADVAVVQLDISLAFISDLLGGGAR